MGSAFESYAGTDVIRMKAGAAVVKHRCVKLGSSEGEVIHSAAIADTTIGIALNSASTGEPVDVQVRGIAKVECAESITLHARVMQQAADGAGSIAPAAGTTAHVVGVALQAGTNGDGDIISVLLSCPAVGEMQA